ncbi:MAG: prolyl oligopeptidase family serine peptidase, partial [Desulforhabdus sp.]|nr:prolyl oligopeptidase family serine peptidase [Desulforhabdus sp.]
TQHYAAPKLLIGHSIGGAAVLHAAAQIGYCKAVATIAAPADPSDLTRFLGNTHEQIEKKGEAQFTLAGREFRIRKQFLDDLQRVRMEETIKALNRPLLLFHSPDDYTVSVENAVKIFRTARYPKSFISLDGADHLLSNRDDSLYVGSVLAAWVEKYI